MTAQAPPGDGPEEQIRAARRQISLLWHELGEVRRQLADALDRISELENGRETQDA